MNLTPDSVANRQHVNDHRRMNADENRAEPLHRVAPGRERS